MVTKFVKAILWMTVILSIACSPFVAGEGKGTRGLIPASSSGDPLAKLDPKERDSEERDSDEDADEETYFSEGTTLLIPVLLASLFFTKISDLCSQGFMRSIFHPPTTCF